MAFNVFLGLTLSSRIVDSGFEVIGEDDGRVIENSFGRMYGIANISCISCDRKDETDM